MAKQCCQRGRQRALKDLHRFARHEQVAAAVELALREELRRDEGEVLRPDHAVPARIRVWPADGAGGVGADAGQILPDEDTEVEDVDERVIVEVAAPQRVVVARAGEIGDIGGAGDREVIAVRGAEGVQRISRGDALVVPARHLDGLRRNAAHERERLFDDDRGAAADGRAGTRRACRCGS